MRRELGALRQRLEKLRRGELSPQEALGALPVMCQMMARIASREHLERRLEHQIQHLEQRLAAVEGRGRP